MSSIAVGIIGCGNISSIYLQNCHQRFRGIHIAAVADIDVARAQARATEFGVAKGCSVDELLADPEIKINRCQTALLEIYHKVPKLRG